MKYLGKHFSLLANFDRHELLLKISILNSNKTSTKEYPYTTSFLDKHLPNIYKNVCHNTFNKPFKDEVKDTPLGHFFEHILITLLCEEDTKNKIFKSHYVAWTEWNWVSNKKGTFEIVINSKNSDINEQSYFDALQKTITLVEIFLNDSSSRRGAAALDVIQTAN